VAEVVPALPLTAALLLTLSLAAALTIASTLAPPPPPTAAATVRWLPERVNLPLDEVAVVFAIGVITAQLQRPFVCLDRIGPFLDRLRGADFRAADRAIQCIAEV